MYEYQYTVSLERQYKRKWQTGKQANIEIMGFPRGDGKPILKNGKPF